MSRRRVVVTGLGLISPVGNTVADGWANLIAGRDFVGADRNGNVWIGIRRELMLMAHAARLLERR